MRKSLLLYGHVVILMSLLLGCGEDKAQVSVTPEEVILSATVARYSGLSDSEREILGKYCCTYSRTGGWTSGDLERFEPEEGYFVRAVINADALAQFTFIHSCGGATYVESCSQEELSQKMTQTLQDSNPYGLYGKYKNRWVFLGASGEIPPTEKFEGFRLLSVERQQNPRHDHVLIGPLPEEPTRMRIQPHYNLSEQGQVLPSPEAVL